MVERDGKVYLPTRMAKTLTFAEYEEVPSAKEEVLKLKQGMKKLGYEKYAIGASNIMIRPYIWVYSNNQIAEVLKWTDSENFDDCDSNLAYKDKIGFFWFPASINGNQSDQVLSFDDGMAANKSYFVGGLTEYLFAVPLNADGTVILQMGTDTVQPTN